MSTYIINVILLVTQNISKSYICNVKYNCTLHYSSDDKIKANLMRDLLSMTHDKLLSEKGILGIDEIEHARCEL
jgi:hypothetical protein